MAMRQVQVAVNGHPEPEIAVATEYGNAVTCRPNVNGNRIEIPTTGNTT